MTVYVNRIRRSYQRRRSVREIAVAMLLLAVLVVLLSVAACEQATPPVVVDQAEAARRIEIVGRWYAEIYPAYGVVRR